MGVSLFYQTTKPVPAAVKSAILAEAGRINGEREWWCESLVFFEVGGRRKRGPTPPAGDTKLFNPDADEGDDDFMASRDAAFIVQHLARWSVEYGIDWTLEMAGTEVGTIVAGEVSPAGLFRWDQPETPAERRRASQARRRYEARNG